MKKLWLVLLLFCAFYVNKAQSQLHGRYSYYLTVCAIFNNEGPWLKEWLEYHKLIGVEHFTLYNNGSNDNYLEVLGPYIRSGEVTLIDWPTPYLGKEVWAWVDKVQVPAYMDCIKHMKGVARWVAFIDIDEFIVPRKHDDLVSFLEEYDRDSTLGGLTVNWSCYGASNLWDIPKGRLMIEMLTRKDDGTHIWATVVKSIVHPDLVTGCSYPHFFQYQKGIYGKNPRGDLFKKHQPACIDRIKINHYYMRTLNYFYNDKMVKKKKMDNKHPSRKEIADMLNIGNKMEDPDRDIFRFVPKLRKIMGLDP
jgi:hypothetical protein